jgi:hypothetical protein
MRMILLAAAALLFAPAVRAAETYQVANWPKDIDTIPCSAWDHNPDGSWALRGYIKVGGSVIENVGFNKGDSSARLLDKKCGK